MPVVIATVGGEGTRLFPLTLDCPKPMIDVCNSGILTIALEPLVDQGCRNIILASKGGHTKQLDLYFKDGSGFFSRIGIFPENEFSYQPNYKDKGSGDSVRFCIDFFNIENSILVISGDNIFDVNILEMMKQHERTNALLTVCLKKVDESEDISHFGVAQIDENLKIKGFVEKPPKGEEPSRLINTSIYLFSPKIKEVFRNVEGENISDIGGHLIPYLVKKEYPVYGYITEGYWIDVGTPQRYNTVTQDLLDGKVKHIDFGHRRKHGNWISPATLDLIEEKMIKGSIRVRNSLIDRNCRIGDNVEINRSVIGHTCIIGDNVKINESTIMNFAIVEDNTIINKGIVGKFARIGKNSVIDADLDMDFHKEDKTPVVGNDVEILENSIIGPGKRVAPIYKSHDILKTGKFVELGVDDKNIYFIEK